MRSAFSATRKNEEKLLKRKEYLFKWQLILDIFNHSYVITAMDEPYIQYLPTLEEFDCSVPEDFKTSFVLEDEYVFQHIETGIPNLEENEEISPLSYVNMGVVTPDKADNAISCKPRRPKSGTCKECNKTFAYLKKHMLVHSKLKPYKCEVCGHQCSQKSNLNRHYKSKHEDKSVDCPKCGSKFSRKDKLKEHTKKVYQS